jgi:rhodanese-related sulfurtransferase
MDHSVEFIAVVNDAKTRIKEISVADALAAQEQGAILIDVREDREWYKHAAGAEHIGKGVIERDIAAKHPDKQAELILYCGGGYRSALAADMLQIMGYTKVYSLAGGWKAWCDADAPTEVEIPF